MQAAFAEERLMTAIALLKEQTQGQYGVITLLDILDISNI